MEVRDFENAEEIARKLIDLELEDYPRTYVRYESDFHQVKKGILRKKKTAKREGEQLRVWTWLNLDSLEAYEKTITKLRTIAPTWQKRPLSHGRGLELSATIGKVSIEVNVDFPHEQVIPIMSKILNCEIIKHEETHPAFTSVSYACARK